MYQRDETKKGREVALAFTRAFAEHDVLPCSDVVEFGDDMQLRQNGCLLEFSLDCEHWFTLYDPTDCINSLLQPSGGGALKPGECREYDAALSGNGVWFLPFAVSEGMTIEVTDARGAWTGSIDTSPIPVPWYCPNGASYLAGTCAGSGTPTAFGADPSLNFMTLVSRIDQATPIWFDSLSGIQTVPSGVSNDTLWFQANNADLAAGQGTIGFHVKVCEPDTVWTHIFDFTEAVGSWVNGTGSGCELGVYSSPTGWQNTDCLAGSHRYRGIDIVRNFDARTITHVKVTFSIHGIATDQPSYVDRFAIQYNTEFKVLLTFADTTEGDDLIQEFTTPVDSVDHLRVLAISSDYGVDTYAGSVVITRIEVSGNGTDPF